jgi:hypothetical protein
MPAQESAPPDLQKLLDDLSRNEETVARLVAGLSEAQLKWQPDGGRAWSILQCLEHLTLSNRLYIDQMKPAVERAPRFDATPKRFRPGLLAGMFIASLEPPLKFKAPAPKQLLPASKSEPTKVLEEWRGSHETLRKLAAVPVDWDRVTLKNPFFQAVSMKLGTAMLVLPAHERRHLWQAEKVLARLKVSG